MDINSYTYQDFLFFSLSFFGLQNVVKQSLEHHQDEDLNITNINNVMDACHNLDLSDRAKIFRILYRKFYKKDKISREKLITDMLYYCD